MVKKVYLIFLLLIVFFWSCVTYQPPPPTLYIGNPPPTYVTTLSLEDRIRAEDAWQSLKQGNWKKAKQLIIELGSGSPFYYIGLGYVHYLLKEMQTAEEYFKAATQNYPEMVLSHVGLAQIYQDTRREELAFSEFREVLKREPAHPWARSLYENLRTRKTQETLDEAKIFLTEGNTENAKGSFLKALYYSPQSIEAHLALASIYKKEDQLKSALIHLEAASESDPQNKEILKEYAEILFQTDKLTMSFEIYRELQKRDPEDQDVERRLETLKNRLGIFELPSQYEAIPASEAVTKEEIAAILAVELKDNLKDPTQKPPIIIDISTSWASEFILKMTSLGILDVYPNHTFQPKKVTTRAEMAEILVRLINLLKRQGYRLIQQIPADRIQIPDVSLDNYYYQPITLIISYDIMTLSQEKTFNPDLPISGQEALKLVNIILTLIK